MQLAWPHAIKTPFVPNWHIPAICWLLEEVSNRRIKKAAISISPGSGKSILTDVLWQAWDWIRWPERKWICGSFDYKLVGKRDGARLMNLLDSKWWRARWPHVRTTKASPSAQDFDTIGGGFRFATSPRGKGTGRHCDTLLIDDPIKPLDVVGRRAVTKAALIEAENWYTQTLSTRLIPETAAEVCIMQRLHMGDLTALFLQDKSTYHVRFPMMYEPEFPDPLDPRRERGEFFWPQRYTAIHIAALIVKLGEHGTAAQLQQRPAVLGGGIFKRHEWRFWSASKGRKEPCLCKECFTAKRCDPSHATDRECATLPDRGLDLASWDMAFKKLETSDYVAGTGWRAVAGRIYCRFVSNARRSFKESLLEITRKHIQYPGIVLVESAANGPACESALENHVKITLVNAEGGKEARAWASTPAISMGEVFLQHPSEDPDTWELLHQAESFPFDVHDDIVDSVSQAVVWLSKRGSIRAAAALDLIGRTMGHG